MKFVFWFGLSVALCSCYRHVDLSTLKHIKFSYESLPIEVKKAFRENFVNDGLPVQVVNLDSNVYNVSVIAEQEGPFAKPVILIVKRYKLQMRSCLPDIGTNVPEPYIFYNKSIYYPKEYNIRDTFQLKQSDFYEIDLDGLVFW